MSKQPSSTTFIPIPADGYSAHLSFLKLLGILGIVRNLYIESDGNSNYVYKVIV